MLKLQGHERVGRRRRHADRGHARPARSWRLHPDVPPVDAAAGRRQRCVQRDRARDTGRSGRFPEDGGFGPASPNGTAAPRRWSGSCGRPSSIAWSCRLCPQASPSSTSRLAVTTTGHLGERECTAAIVEGASSPDLGGRVRCDHGPEDRPTGGSQEAVTATLKCAYQAGAPWRESWLRRKPWIASTPRRPAPRCWTSKEDRSRSGCCGRSGRRCSCSLLRLSVLP